MNSKFREVLHVLCCAAVAINTVMFGYHLFDDNIFMAKFNLISALGCWVGIFVYGKKENGS